MEKIKLDKNEMKRLETILKNYNTYLENNKGIKETVVNKAERAKENKKATKAKVILLRGEGKNINDIAHEMKLSRRTVLTYIDKYLSSGISFVHDRSKYKKSKLNSIDELLKDEFKVNPPLSYKEASQRIKNLYDVTISESATRAYLNKRKIMTSRSLKHKKNDRT